MSMYDDGYLKWFDRHGKDRPSHDPHGTPEEIRENLKRLHTSNWRLEGNRLIADTPDGELVQFISTDYICQGTDKQGLPILVKISV